MKLKPTVYCIIDDVGNIKRCRYQLKFYEDKQEAFIDCYKHNVYFAEKWHVVKCEIVEVYENED